MLSKAGLHMSMLLQKCAMSQAEGTIYYPE